MDNLSASLTMQVLAWSATLSKNANEVGQYTVPMIGSGPCIYLAMPLFGHASFIDSNLRDWDLGMGQVLVSTTEVQPLEQPSESLTLRVGAPEGFACNLFAGIPDFFCYVPKSMPNGLTTIAPVIQALSDQARLKEEGHEAIMTALIRALVCKLMSVMVAQEKLPVGLLAGFADKRMAKALAVMHEQPDGDWGLNSLAKEAGTSRTSFATSFKKITGITPLDYLTTVRMNKALFLLQEGDMHIEKIATACGYASESAFYKVFRKRFGTTPRKMMRDSQ